MTSNRSTNKSKVILMILLMSSSFLVGAQFPEVTWNDDTVGEQDSVVKESLEGRVPELPDRIERDGYNVEKDFFSYGTDAMNYTVTITGIDQDFDGKNDSLHVEIIVAWDTSVDSSVDTLRLDYKLYYWDEELMLWVEYESDSTYHKAFLNGYNTVQKFFQSTSIMQKVRVEVSAYLTYGVASSKEYGRYSRIYALNLRNPDKYIYVDSYQFTPKDCDGDASNDCIDFTMSIKYLLDVPISLDISFRVYRGNMRNSIYYWSEDMGIEPTSTPLTKRVSFSYVVNQTDDYYFLVEVFRTGSVPARNLAFNTRPFDYGNSSYIIDRTESLVGHSGEWANAWLDIRGYDYDLDTKNDTAEVALYLEVFKDDLYLGTPYTINVYWLNGTKYQYIGEFRYVMYSYFYKYTVKKFSLVSPYIGKYKLNMSYTSGSTQKYLEEIVFFDGAYDAYSPYSIGGSANMTFVDNDKDYRQESVYVEGEVTWNLGSSNTVDILLASSHATNKFLVLERKSVTLTATTSGRLLFNLSREFKANISTSIKVIIQFPDLVSQNFTIKSKSVDIGPSFVNTVDYKFANVEKDKDGNGKIDTLDTKVKLAMIRSSVDNMEVRVDGFYMNGSTFRWDYWGNTTVYLSINKTSMFYDLYSIIPINAMEAGNYTFIFTFKFVNSPKIDFIVQVPWLHADKYQFVSYKVNWTDLDMDGDVNQTTDTFKVDLLFTWNRRKDAQMETYLYINWYNSTGKYTLNVLYWNRTLGADRFYDNVSLGSKTWHAWYDGSYEIVVEVFLDSILDSTLTYTKTWSDVYAFKKISEKHTFVSRDVNNNSIPDTLEVSSEVSWEVYAPYNLELSLDIYYYNTSTKRLDYTDHLEITDTLYMSRTVVYTMDWGSKYGGDYQVYFTARFDGWEFASGMYWFNGTEVAQVVTTTSTTGTTSTGTTSTDTPSTGTTTSETTSQVTSSTPTSSTTSSTPTSRPSTFSPVSYLGLQLALVFSIFVLARQRRRRGT